MNTSLVQFNNCQWITGKQKYQDYKLKIQENGNKKENFRNKQSLPGKRWGHNCVIYEKQMFLFGGISQSLNIKNVDSVYVLNLDNFEWNYYFDGTKPYPIRRDSFSLCKIGNQFIIFGGTTENETLQDMWSFNCQHKIWNQINQKGNIPTKREGHSTISMFDRYIFLFGGWDGNILFNDSYLYDNENQQWQFINLLQNIKPQPRESFSMVTIRDSIYIFGGQGQNEQSGKDVYFNDIWVFKFQICRQTGICSGFWTQKNVDGQISPRTSNTATLYKDRYIIIVGGECEDQQEQQIEKKCNPKNDIYIYDYKTEKIIQIEPKNQELFTPRCVHSACIYNDNIIIYGGLSDYNASLDDLLILELVQDDEKNGKKLELKDICNNCKYEITNPMDIFDEEEEIQQNNLIQPSIQLLQKISNLFQSPMISLRNLIQILQMKNRDQIQISHHQKKKINFDNSTIKQIQNINQELLKNINNKLNKYYITFDFNGDQLDIKEQLNILNNYNQFQDINQSLILNCLRIGKSLVIINNTQNQTTISLISSNMLNNGLTDKLTYFMSSWNNQEFLSVNGYQNKKNIYDILQGYMDENNILPQQLSNRLIIFDLNFISQCQNYELNFAFQNDIILNQPQYAKNTKQNKNLCNSLNLNYQYFYYQSNHQMSLSINQNLIENNFYFQNLKKNKSLLLIYHHNSQDYQVDIFISKLYIDNHIDKYMISLQQEQRVIILDDDQDLVYKKLILHFQQIYQEFYEYQQIIENQDNVQNYGILLYKDNYFIREFQNEQFNILNFQELKIQQKQNFSGIINFDKNINYQQQLQIFDQINKEVKNICKNTVNLMIKEYMENFNQVKKIKL